MSEPIGYPEPQGALFTAGHSGSITSQERAVGEALSGMKRRREAEVYRILMQRRGMGITVKELREMTGWHHGQASSVLSTLHKGGQITRLTERRNRCQVYVLPSYVGDRQEAPHGRQKMVDTSVLWEAYRAGYLAGDDDPMDDDMVQVLFRRWLDGRG